MGQRTEQGEAGVRPARRGEAYWSHHIAQALADHDKLLIRLRQLIEQLKSIRESLLTISTPKQNEPLQRFLAHPAIGEDGKGELECYSSTSRAAMRESVTL
jgi:hypothetical protein